MGHTSIVCSFVLEPSSAVKDLLDARRNNIISNRCNLVSMVAVYPVRANQMSIPCLSRMVYRTIEILLFRRLNIKSDNVYRRRRITNRLQL